MSQILIGKYTLESLVMGMYSSSFDMFREYIQNSVDSIDAAKEKGIKAKNDFRIIINVDPILKRISILDNGTGIHTEDATTHLFDIGNSKKMFTKERGFRGIGRLSGLGYCEKLMFITSAIGEPYKTEITFNAKKLKELLLPGNTEVESVSEVINRITTIKKIKEKVNVHYFEVILEGVSDDELLNKDLVKNYLLQTAPLHYDPDFKWSSVIKNKCKMFGYNIPEYVIFLEIGDLREQLYKPYKDTFISDRVKKNKDNIKEIEFISIKNEKDEVQGIFWYAKTSFYGTIMDENVKGIRIKKGNILIGDKQTCNKFFRDERFNGWLLGEIFILDSNLIPNARRDDFEKNRAYIEIQNGLTELAAVINKDIRKLSYDRSVLTQKATIESEVDDFNNLCVEDMDFVIGSNEFNFMNENENDDVASSMIYDKLSILLNQKPAVTKYKLLEINSRLTVEQKKTIERVFNVIKGEISGAEADKIINIIISNF